MYVGRCSLIIHMQLWFEWRVYLEASVIECVRGSGIPLRVTYCNVHNDSDIQTVICARLNSASTTNRLCCAKHIAKPRSATDSSVDKLQCLYFSQFHSSTTQQWDRVPNITALFSGVPGFKSRPGDRLSWQKYFVVCLSLPQTNSITLRPQINT